MFNDLLSEYLFLGVTSLRQCHPGYNWCKMVISSSSGLNGFIPTLTDPYSLFNLTELVSSVWLYHMLCRNDILSLLGASFHIKVTLKS